jgi:hypothetical protein
MPVKTGFFPFSRACSAWRDVIQAATVVNYSALQKRVLMHEEDHPAQYLAAQRRSKLNRLVAVVRSQGFHIQRLFHRWIQSHNGTKARYSIHPSLSRKWVILFAPTIASIVLTL